jgi:hypothetical protein
MQPPTIQKAPEHMDDQELHAFRQSSLGAYNEHAQRELQLRLMATLCGQTEALSKIADEQLKSAKIIERHTESILLLAKALLDETKLLRWLTVGLLIFTAALIVLTVKLAQPH